MTGITNYLEQPSGFFTHGVIHPLYCIKRSWKPT